MLHVLSIRTAPVAIAFKQNCLIDIPLLQAKHAVPVSCVQSQFLVGEADGNRVGRYNVGDFVEAFFATASTGASAKKQAISKTSFFTVRLLRRASLVWNMLGRVRFYYEEGGGRRTLERKTFVRGGGCVRHFFLG